jgi:ankyrin repeat protein
MNDYSGKTLKDAVWNNRPDQIKRTIELGADVDWIGPGCMGRTQLFVCIIHKRFDALKCLLEAGANPNIGDDFGKKPLHLAKSSELEEFVSLLEAYGAK